MKTKEQIKIRINKLQNILNKNCFSYDQEGGYKMGKIVGELNGLYWVKNNPLDNAKQKG